MNIVYTAEPTPAKFHLSKKLVRGIMGPIGSGKSVACCNEIFRRSMEQKAYFDDEYPKGIRRSRWAIIRNTYRELTDTTMQTWFDWFPEKMGNLLKKDMKFVIKQRLADGTLLHLEILFRALDRPGDIKKLLSLEVTGGWINEAREIPKAVLDMLIGRLGRYPSLRVGGPSWYGCLMDTNPPDDDHWWYKLFEENCPHNYQLFRQPSGLGSDAENKQNLPDGYYDNMRTGKDEQWVDVYCRGKYGFIQDGKPIYEEYQDDVHYAPEGFLVPENAEITIGLDFGLTPAAVFFHKNVFGQWLAFDEIVTFSMGAVNFGKILGQKMRKEWPNATFDICGDPSGDTRAETDEQTPYDILATQGINAYGAHTNDPMIRRETVANKLTTLAMNGKPAFMIGPRCKMLRKAMNGGYKYKRLQIVGAERFHDRPDKGPYSHVAEAAQYALLAGGEDLSIVGGTSDWSKPLDYTELDRGII